MRITMQSYLSNPAGKGNATAGITSRKRELDAQYDVIKNNIRVTNYVLTNQKGTNDVSFLIWFKIPSANRDTIYDVVLEFDAKDVRSGSSRLEELPLRVFSNCPSFCYTYAYVFRAKDWFCTWGTHKLKQEVFRSKPTQSNPYKQIGLEKSLYFAMRTVRGISALQGKEQYDQATRITSTNEILKGISTEQEVERKSPTKKTVQTAKEKQEKVVSVNHSHSPVSGGNPIKSLVKKMKITRVTKKGATTRASKKI